MAKKTKPQQQQLSPEKYIRLKARKLPIAHCYINENWKEAGIASIIVTRQHQSGNYTSAQYLVDTFCLGVKDTNYHFNISSEELNEMLNRFPNCTEITYNEAHNIIFGAITFAEEEAEVLPHKEFELTQFLLEEDTDDIPLIDYEYGKDGKPYLMVGTRLEASKYLPKLQGKFGKNFAFLIREDDDEYDEYDDYDDMDDDNDIFKGIDPAIAKELSKGFEKIKSNMIKVKALTHTTYTYVHPEYPATLKLTHSELESILYNPEYFYSLPHHVIKQLLALPRESLIADLNQTILYELGQSCEIITDEMYDQENNVITHALFLLGELKATESLQTVLEVLRQSAESTDFYFGDSKSEVLRPTLYYIGRNQTDALLKFMKEPGLNDFNRAHISPVMATIAIHEPERRDEVIDWYRQLIRFLIENVSDSSVYDASLSGSLLFELIDILAAELLPEIEELFATEQVDFMCCGMFPEVKEAILEADESLTDYSLVDIYQRYEQYEQQWDN